MFTLIALAIGCLSLFLMLGGLRMVATDTFEILSKMTVRARNDGELVPRLAFVMLWGMIFVLSYF